jgi:hypothetical protein
MLAGWGLLAACVSVPASTPDLVATQVAVERAAAATITAEAPTPTSTLASTPTHTPTSTPTPTPTSTSTPTDTPTPMPTPTMDLSHVDGLTLEEYGRAIEQVSGTLRNEPDDAELYYLRGSLYYARYQTAYEADDPRADGEDFWRAVTDFTKAIELDHEYAEAYSYRGLTYLGLGLTEQGLADYNTAIDLDPQLAIAYYGRAFAYEERGELESAIADYKRFLELSDDPYWRAEAGKRLKALRDVLP